MAQPDHYEYSDRKKAVINFKRDCPEGYKVFKAALDEVRKNHQSRCTPAILNGVDDKFFYDADPQLIIPNKGRLGNLTYVLETVNDKKTRIIKYTNAEGNVMAVTDFFTQKIPMFVGYNWKEGDFEYNNFRALNAFPAAIQAKVFTKVLWTLRMPNENHPEDAHLVHLKECMSRVDAILERHWAVRQLKRQPRTWHLCGIIMAAALVLAAKAIYYRPQMRGSKSSTPSVGHKYDSGRTGAASAPLSLPMPQTQRADIPNISDELTPFMVATDINAPFTNVSAPTLQEYAAERAVGGVDQPATSALPVQSSATEATTSLNNETAVAAQPPRPINFHMTQDGWALHVGWNTHGAWLDAMNEEQLNLTTEDALGLLPALPEHESVVLVRELVRRGKTDDLLMAMEDNPILKEKVIAIKVEQSFRTGEATLTMNDQHDKDVGAAMVDRAANQADQFQSRGINHFLDLALTHFRGNPTEMKHHVTASHLQRWIDTGHDEVFDYVVGRGWVSEKAKEGFKAFAIANGNYDAADKTGAWDQMTKTERSQLATGMLAMGQPLPRQWWEMSPDDIQDSFDTSYKPLYSALMGAVQSETMSEIGLGRATNRRSFATMATSLYGPASIDGWRKMLYDGTLSQ